MNKGFKFMLLWMTVPLLAGCGTGTIDLSGYPDKAREGLYSEGRIGGDKGLADFDLRKAWQDL